MAKKEIVFVYGTLKSNGKFNYALQGQKLLGEAETAVPRALNFGAYPFVTKKEKGKVTVKGEVYEIGGRTLKHLDAIEGHPSFYVREKEEIVLKSGERMSVWMYFLPEDRQKFVGNNVILIENGIFPVDWESIQILCERRDNS